MNSPSRSITIAAGCFGFLAVALGAFGAHALKPTLEANGRVDVWHTAVLYHLLHSVALLAIGSGLDPRSAGLRPANLEHPPVKDWRPSIAWCWSLGIGLFSGSLYWLALGGPRFLGPITPLGGIAFLIGWALVVVGAVRGGTRYP